MRTFIALVIYFLPIALFLSYDGLNDPHPLLAAIVLFIAPAISIVKSWGGSSGRQALTYNSMFTLGVGIMLGIYSYSDPARITILGHLLLALICLCLISWLLWKLGIMSNLFRDYDREKSEA